MVEHIATIRNHVLQEYAHEKTHKLCKMDYKTIITKVPVLYICVQKHGKKSGRISIRMLIVVLL